MGKFNIRVYGLLFSDDEKSVLISNEKLRSYTFSKFPGGGLEFGEGAVDCIKREFKEELNVEVHKADHFYTTDFFQPSAFDNTQQIISIYYKVKLLPNQHIPIHKGEIEFDVNLEKQELFKWEQIDEYLSDKVTFQIDKIVSKKLFEQFT